MRLVIAGCLSWVVLMSGVGSAKAYWPGMQYCGLGMNMAGCGPMGCAPMAGCGPCMQMQSVQRTVMVPSMTYQTRTVSQVVCRPEVRQGTCTVMVSVPVQQQVTRQVCTMVPETRTQTVNYTACKVVMQSVQCQKTVMVPETQTRTGTRRVCTMVPVVMTRTICEDQGSWQTVASDCGGCGNSCGGAPQMMSPAPAVGPGPAPAQATPMSPSDTVPPPAPGPMTKKNSSTSIKIVNVALRRTMQYGGLCCGSSCGGYACGSTCGNGCSPCQQMVRRVWVPNVVQREVQYTSYQQKVDDVPYSYQVVVCKPVMQTQIVQVPQVVREPQTKQVSCTVLVPRTENRVVTLTSMRCQPQQRTYSYTVAVPVTIQKQIQVPVCTMVPKVITCQIPVPMACAPAGCGAAGCGPRGCGY